MKLALCDLSDEHREEIVNRIAYINLDIQRLLQRRQALIDNLADIDRYAKEMDDQSRTDTTGE